MIATLYVKCTEMDCGMSGGTLRLRLRGALLAMCCANGVSIARLIIGCLIRNTAVG
jgi:hypothetical protein